MSAEMLGATPRQVLLVGTVGEAYEPGRPLSEVVRHAVGNVIDAILAELEQLGVKYEKRRSPSKPHIC